LDSVLIIDVRRRSEVSSNGKIPNSFIVPVQEILSGHAFELKNTNFKKRYGLIKPRKSVEFVVSCASGKRASKAGKYFKSLGYQQIKVYKGGFNDWIKNGGEIIKETGKSKTDSWFIDYTIDFLFFINILFIILIDYFSTQFFRALFPI
jgi:rhodanese-related sulfurtransferase